MRRSLVMAGLLFAVSCTPGHRASSPPTPMPPVVEPSPGLANASSSSWSSARVSSDGRTLTVAFTGGARPCGILDRVGVAETKTSVTITVFLGADPAFVASLKGKPLVCNEIGIPRAALVRLRDRLGSRPLIDGSSGEARVIGSPDR